MLPGYITKIEGHGVLNIHFKECKARLEVTEGERLFEAVLLGQAATRAPFITSRICGVCPTAHNLASIKAVENALGIKISPIDAELRNLLLAGQIIFSHLLHLFFLVLPDYYQVSSALEIAEKFPAEYHIALNLKRLSDQLLAAIGGRPIHPTLTTVGGFLKYPQKGSLVTLREEIDQVTDEAEDFVKIFAQIQIPQTERQIEYLAMDIGQYQLYDGDIVSTSGKKFTPFSYKSHIKEKVKDYSTAKFGYLSNDGGFLVGALARLTIHKSNKLNPQAKRLFQKYFQEEFSPAKHNPFNNILAQAIELMHFLEEAGKIIDKLLATDIRVVPAKINIPKLSKPNWGIGAVEAPRGTLYHAYEINPDGKIVNADIVTPTVQNLTSIEEDAENLLRTLQLDKKSPNICVRELEMLIRAYDPCITCSVH